MRRAKSRARVDRRLAAFCFPVLLAVSLSCRSGAEPRTPVDTLQAYAEALSKGESRKAYSLLSAEAKKSIPFEVFERIIAENPDEVAELAKALSRPAGAPLVTARVVAPGGEQLLMVYENGSWRIDGSSIDLYGQSTPAQALAAFVRAFENQRYDVLMRFVPDGEREGLDAKKLRAAWEGEQKDEMEELVQALEAALPSARIEQLGDRATMAYGAAGTVELIRQHGEWRIEDLR
ncbi:MAG TPA: hypothetical protein VF989_02650 [Polyangiaceae bacterium]